VERLRAARDREHHRRRRERDPDQVDRGEPLAQPGGGGQRDDHRRRRAQDSRVGRARVAKAGVPERRVAHEAGQREHDRRGPVPAGERWERALERSSEASASRGAAMRARAAASVSGPSSGGRAWRGGSCRPRSGPRRAAGRRRYGGLRRWNGPVGMGPTGPSATIGALLPLLLLRGLLLRHRVTPPPDPRASRGRSCSDSRGGPKTCQGENTG
jgi:hypothetical protein